MKQSLALAALTTFAFTISNYSAPAQDAWTSSNIKPALLAASARAIMSSEESDRNALRSMKEMNGRIFKDFARDYTNAVNISTYKENGQLFVTFSKDNIRTRVSYSKNGHRTSTLKYLEADQIPEDISEAVLDYYPRYEITRAQHVSVGTDTAWLISIENKKGYKTIRMIDGQMDVYSEFLKQH